MKRLLTVLLLIVSASVQAMNIKPTLSGSWYDPAHSGHGFSIEVMASGETIIYWYAYDHGGEPIFLFAQGPNVGNRVEADVYWHEGMKFGEFNANDLRQSVWGTLTIEFHSCTSATVNYQSQMSHGGMSFGSGTFNVKRLASIEHNECNEHEIGGNYVLAADSLDSLGFAGHGVLFENDVFMYAGVAPNGEAFVGFGEIAANNGSFTASIEEIGLDGSYNRYSRSGKYLPGMFGWKHPTGRDLRAVEKRVEYMTPPHHLYANRTWNVTDHFGAAIGSLALNENGSVSGSGMGCTLSGKWYVPNPKLNQQWMDLTLSGCSIAGDSLAVMFYDWMKREMQIMGITGYGAYILIGK